MKRTLSVFVMPIPLWWSKGH